MKDTHCAYCMDNELVNAFGKKICDIGVSKVYLFLEQSHKGRVIVAYKEHVSELADLGAAQRDAYFADVARVAKALHELYQPAKVNYGAYGDTGGHLHFHLVPKYAHDSFEWGSVFQMNPGRVTLDEAGYKAMISDIRSALGL